MFHDLLKLSAAGFARRRTSGGAAGAGAMERVPAGQRRAVQGPHHMPGSQLVCSQLVCGQACTADPTLPLTLIE